jgi:hypothetical protein
MRAGDSIVIIGRGRWGEHGRCTLWFEPRGSTGGGPTVFGLLEKAGWLVVLDLETFSRWGWARSFDYLHRMLEQSLRLPPPTPDSKPLDLPV